MLIHQFYSIFLLLDRRGDDRDVPGAPPQAGIPPPLAPEPQDGHLLREPAQADAGGHNHQRRAPEG